MLVPTKKPPIEHEPVELRFVGPSDRKDQAVEALSSLGFRDVSDSVPWREAFRELDDAALPGAALAGARAREGITQQELSRRTGIPQRHISEMENGKRPIGRENARKLGRALGMGFKVFM